MTNQPTVPGSNLAQKIALARKSMGSLAPDKVNKEQNYKYISADKMLERAGDILAEVGVAIIPSVVETQITAVERVGKNPRIDAILKMEFQVTDGLTGYLANWVGCGSDYVTPDKAIYKAITSGHKYFLMKMLNVGVGNEDAEHDNEPSDKEPAKPAAAKPAPAPAPAAKPAAVEVTDELINSETSSTGEKYISLQTPDLVNRLNAMAKSKNGKLTVEEKARKTAVIKAILDLRADYSDESAREAANE